jgi:hypothetical protein
MNKRHKMTYQKDGIVEERGECFGMLSSWTRLRAHLISSQDESYRSSCTSLYCSHLSKCHELESALFEYLPLLYIEPTPRLGTSPCT